MRRLRLFTFLILLLSAVSAGYFAYRQYRETDLEGPALQVPDGVLEISIHAEDSELLQGVTAEDAQDGDVTDSLVIEGVFFASLFCRKLQNVFVGCCTYIL